jgi:hypothetical protein
MMKKVFNRPMFHFIPFPKGMRGDMIASLPDQEFQDVVRQCKEQEDAIVFLVNPDYVITPVSDEFLAVPTGDLAQEFNGMISLNKTGYFIWEQFTQPKSVREALHSAKERFNDESGELELQFREYVNRFRFLKLIQECTKN